MIKPLLKWAGGKRQLRSQLFKRLPERWGTYFEPFFGGGALLVELANQNRLSTAVIGDQNFELVNLYTVVKNQPDALIRELSNYEFRNDEISFNLLKAEFNALTGTKKNAVKRAALLCYLNKHSYNGLWRVNRKGQYNVPFGRYAKPSLPSPESLMQFSRMLQGIAIYKADFAKVVKKAHAKDFIYFDPPYHPVSKTAGFTDYTMTGFGFKEQERLAGIFKKLSDRGIFLMLSNSNTPEIEQLYEGFNIQSVEAKRFINCNGERRGGVSEIIVTNY